MDYCFKGNRFKLMKPTKIFTFVFVAGILIIGNLSMAQTNQELPLWPDGIKNNPVKYKEEQVRTSDVNESSLSGKNRVFSQVSNPTYIIYQPEKSKNTGVAMVICPGGGFISMWRDSFIAWLKDLEFIE